MPPVTLRNLPEIMAVVENVRRFRQGELKAKHAAEDKEIKVGSSALSLADTPRLFHVTRVSKSSQLVIPSVSSENRRFVPIGFESPETLCSNLVMVSVNASLFHFAVLNSTMHMAWLRAVGGRLKSDFRYSKDIVYNNFPWPDLPPPQPSPAGGGGGKQREAIESAAQGVLDARAQFPDATLADLYDPLTMPPVLVKAHQTLDRAVDAAYGKRSFKSDAERVAFLFERYQQLTSLLPIAPNKTPRKRKVAQGGAGD